MLIRASQWAVLLWVLIDGVSHRTLLPPLLPNNCHLTLARRRNKHCCSLTNACKPLQFNDPLRSFGELCKPIDQLTPKKRARILPCAY
uniref:Putative secreted protein n=1 Tax=Anopheles darlingi TaxID=43151 RepID=A0A2M4DED7_ANODA